MLLSRVYFLDPNCGLRASRLLVDGDANEQPVSPSADGRHVPLGRGLCKHYRNIGRSRAVIIGSRSVSLSWVVDKGPAVAGPALPGESACRMKINLSAKSDRAERATQY